MLLAMLELTQFGMPITKADTIARAQRYTSKSFVAQHIHDVGGSELSDAWSITHLDIILVSCWRKYN